MKDHRTTIIEELRYEDDGNVNEPVRPVTKPLPITRDNPPQAEREAA